MYREHIYSFHKSRKKFNLQKTLNEHLKHPLKYEIRGRFFLWEIIILLKFIVIYLCIGLIFLSTLCKRSFVVVVNFFASPNYITCKTYIRTQTYTIYKEIENMRVVCVCSYLRMFLCTVCVCIGKAAFTSHICVEFNWINCCVEFIRFSFSLTR